MASHEKKKTRRTGGAAAILFALADVVLAAALILTLTGRLPGSGEKQLHAVTKNLFGQAGSAPAAENTAEEAAMPDGENAATEAAGTLQGEAEDALPDGAENVLPGETENVLPGETENLPGATEKLPDEGLATANGRAVKLAPAPDGCGLRINGKSYTGSLFTADDGTTLYMQLSELAAAVGSECRADERAGVYSFEFDGVKVKFTKGEKEFSYGGILHPLSNELMPAADGSAELPVPADNVLKVLYPVVFDDEQTGKRSYTEAAPQVHLPAGKKIALLDFHSVTEAGGRAHREFAPYAVQAEAFEKMLEGITAGEGTAICFEDMPELENAECPVMILFEGCSDDVYTTAWPLLQKHGVKATVFVSPGEVGAEGRMTEAQLAEMAESGIISLQCAATAQDRENAGSAEEAMRRATEKVQKISGRVPVACLCRDGSLLETAAKQFNYCVRVDSTRAFDTGRDTRFAVYAYTIYGGSSADELMRNIASAK